MAERAPDDAPRRRAGDPPEEIAPRRRRGDVPPSPPSRSWWGLRKGARGLLAVLNVALGAVALGATALWVLTNTDWGRERVRRFAVDQFDANVNGRLRIGRLSGNLLEGFTLHAFAITDRTGAPFVAADSVRARYSLRALLRKRIELRDVVLHRPVVVLDNPPDGRWNWQRIFEREKPDVPSDPTPGFGDWVSARNLRVVDGDVQILTTWRVDTTKSRAEQQRDIRDALSGKDRVVVVRHPAGFQKVLRFRAIDATLPSAIIADPSIAWRRFDVATAQLVAMPFHEPYAVVRDLRGTIRVDGDSAWWKGLHVRTPGSRLVGDGRYWIAEDDAWVRARGEHIALADFRWAYPRLPSEGGGPARVEYRYTKTYMTFRARDMDVRVGAQRARGSLGLTFVDLEPRDTTIVHDTQLRLANVGMKLLEQVIDFESPRQGTISGQIALEGGTHALRVDGDVEFRERVSGYNRFIGAGIVGFVGQGDEPGESDVVARDLRLRLAPMQVALIGQDFPDVPIRGAVTGNVVLNGTVDEGGTAVGSVVHTDRGARSGFTGRATVHYARTPIRFDIDGRVHPLALQTAGRFVPSVGLRGYVSGPVKVRGNERDFSLDTDLSVAGGGDVAARGRIRLDGRVPAYDLAGRAIALDLHQVVAGMPHTSLTGTAEANGRGVTPETLAGSYAVDLRGSRWDTLAVDSVIGRVRVADGLLGIDRFRIGARGIAATAEGSFGMRRDRAGMLGYRVDVADLSALGAFVPALAGDTGMVQPRPGILASRVRQAREDSVRAARATEIERQVTGRRITMAPVDTPRAVPRGLLAGTLSTSGVVYGAVQDFDVRGSASGDGVIAKGSAASRVDAEYAWTNARTPQSAIAVGVNADSVSAYGFAFDTLDVRLGIDADPRGRVELVARQGTERDYALRGSFVLHPESNELQLSQVRLRFDTTAWTLAQPTTVTWGRRGIAVRDLDLRDGEQGRVWVNGLLPTEGAADLDVALDRFQLAHLSDILQSDVEAAGYLTLRAHLDGTLRNPSFRGAFGIPNPRYGGTRIPQLRGTFEYADERLRTHVLAVRSGNAPPLAEVDATVPVNLALAAVPGDRFTGEGLQVDVRADSMPLDLTSRFTDVVRDVRGVATGRLGVRGSLKQPAITGEVTVRDAQATIAATGVTVDGINGALRMRGDTLAVDSLVGRAGGPLRVSGGIALGNWREPAFDLRMVARDAKLLDNDYGEVFADATVALTGPVRDAHLTGQVTVERGVIYIPESRDIENINAGDPAVFAVLDTALAAERELLPAENPLFDNLGVDLDVRVNRNTWVRTREANVEIFSDGVVHVRRERLGNERATLALTGIIASDRGEYRLLSKRFQVKRASAVFLGQPELNPTLQLTAEYEAHPPGREAIIIRIVVGGTLQRPRVALESDAQPPLSQTDILSFLAFGRESGSLLNLEGSSLTSSTGNPSLIGVGRVAGRRLASVALGLAIDEVEGDAGRDLGVDVINITPEDVPSEFGTSAIESFLLGTRVEVGKYVTPQTFVAVSGSPSILTAGGSQRSPPGIRVERRMGKGWRLQTSLESRLLLRDPSLRENQRTITPISVFGVFLIREWRF